MKTTILKDQHGFAHIVLVLLMVVAVAGVSLFAYQRIQEAKQANGTPKGAKRPLIIKTVEFSTNVDSVGKAITPTSSFALTDGKINVVSALQSPKKGTRVEFVRYRDNKFVDNGSLAVAKDGAQYVSFDFTPKPGKKHPSGLYKVKVYVNGTYQTSGTYSVR